MESLKEIQSRFYKDFPPHPKEQVYGFATPSTMKPTQWTCNILANEREVPFQSYLQVLNYCLVDIFFVLQIQEVESIRYLVNAQFPAM